MKYLRPTVANISIGHACMENVEQPMYMANTLTIDMVAWNAKLNGKEIDLTSREFSLLVFFAEHPGRAYRRNVLIKEAWVSSRPMTVRNVDLYIARLRGKLGDMGKQLIKTIPGVGYRFDPPGNDSFTFRRSEAQEKVSLP